jgi:ABC-type sulfate/molybdate transport systems ATPase subunit
LTGFQSKSARKVLCAVGAERIGKDHLLRCVAGLEKPEGGEILIHQKLVSFC